MKHCHGQYHSKCKNWCLTVWRFRIFSGILPPSPHFLQNAEFSRIHFCRWLLTLGAYRRPASAARPRLFGLSRASSPYRQILDLPLNVRVCHTFFCYEQIHCRGSTLHSYVQAFYYQSSPQKNIIILSHLHESRTVAFTKRRSLRGAMEWN